MKTKKQNIEKQVVNTINTKNIDKNQSTTAAASIKDNSRYSVARVTRLETKIAEQSTKNTLLKYQVTNRMRLDGLNGAVDTEDARAVLIRVCNGIDKNRYPQLKQILDNHGISVATLKAYIRQSVADDYNRYITKTGQIDYTRVVGAICQSIAKQREKAK